MQPRSKIETLLPLQVPAHRTRRLMLYAIRRMGTHGLRDAHAANAMLGGFGANYARPLVLLRAFMAEIVRVAQSKVTIAGCCCVRMSRDEAHLIASLSIAVQNRDGASILLSQCLGTGNTEGVLTCAEALANACADLGKPLS
jgi:hypothetical protein